MKPPKTLLLYKRSAYSVYFLNKASSLFNQQKYFPASEIRKFQSAHQEHYRTLKYVEKTLLKYNFDFQKSSRGRRINFKDYDFIITVGGDGTFLEAARGIQNQLILGVNSDKRNSVGRFCSADRTNFEITIKQILKGGFKSKILQRMQVQIKKNPVRTFQVLNDVLICHQNPAAMSRYYLKISTQQKEEQRSSGLWIATAAGSSGAIHSAGGKLIDSESRLVQYCPRELYHFKAKQYKLKGAVLKLVHPIVVTSLMRNGLIFIDGAHLKYSFNFGDQVKISHSSDPLKVIEAA